VACKISDAVGTAYRGSLSIWYGGVSGVETRDEDLPDPAAAHGNALIGQTGY
jgi:hypothetical protein